MEIATIAIIAAVAVAVLPVVLKIYAILTMGKCRSDVSLVGRTALVTGGNSGIGYEVALNFATRGARVVIADISDAAAAVKEIVDITGNSNVTWMQVDLSDFQSVREFAKKFKENENRLDLLINNAGTSDFNNVYTSTGALKIMAVNHYGHFLLTHLLLDTLRATEKSRVVFTSSILAHVHCLKQDKINDPPGVWRGFLYTFLAYGNTKICNLITSNNLAKRGIFSVAVNPGFVKTNINNVTFNVVKRMFFSLPFILISKLTIYLYSKTPREGAQTILEAALGTGKSGQFLSDCKPFPQPRCARNEDFCNAVWEQSERLVGLADSEKIPTAKSPKP